MALIDPCSGGEYLTTADVADGVFSNRTLKQRAHAAGQRQVAAVNDRLYGVRQRGAQQQRLRRIGGDVGVGAVEAQAHLDVVGDCPDAPDALGRSLRGELAGVGVDETGQGNGALCHGDADAGRVDL